MEIRQLRYFVEICRCKSFSRAAGHCFISPQGMSMSMMRLEEELGLKLFIRSPMGISLTPHAEFLLPKARKILAIADECDAYFNSDRLDETLLPLYCSHGTIEEYAGAILPEFQKAYPEIRIQVHECTDLDADDAVLNDECELALTVGPLPEGRFTSGLILTTDYALIVNSQDPLAARGAITVAELKDLPLAVMKSGVRTYSCLCSACRKEQFEPLIHTFADNILLVFYLATQTGVYGISTLALFKRLNPPGLSAVPINDPDFSWRIYLIRKAHAALSVPAELLWKSLLPKKPIRQ